MYCPRCVITFSPLLPALFPLIPALRICMEVIPYVTVIGVQDAVLFSPPNVSFPKQALSIFPESPPRQLCLFGFFKNVNIEKAA